jgi:hypothetical protein
VRDDELGAGYVDDLSQALDRAEDLLAAGSRERGLARTLERLAAGLTEEAGSPIAVKRRLELAETLAGIAARLR